MIFPMGTIQLMSPLKTAQHHRFSNKVAAVNTKILMTLIAKTTNMRTTISFWRS